MDAPVYRIVRAHHSLNVAFDNGAFESRQVAGGQVVLRYVDVDGVSSTHASRTHRRRTRPAKGRRTAAETKRVSNTCCGAVDCQFLPLCAYIWSGGIVLCTCFHDFMSSLLSVSLFLLCTDQLPSKELASKCFNVPILCKNLGSSPFCMPIEYICPK